MRLGGHPQNSVRFFTSAALRSHEQVAGETLGWIPRAITVEFEGDRPVTGVWRSAEGDRCVCWYSAQLTEELAAAHMERYGEEPFWVVDRTDPRGGRNIVVHECDARGYVIARRRWEFDTNLMPLRDEGRAADGSLLWTRTYECTNNGVPFAATELRPGGDPVVLQRPIAFPAPALAGEPFPCGGAIGRDGPRLVAPIQQNSYQGRYWAVYREGPIWKRGLATIATSKRAWPAELSPILDFSGNGIAPLVEVGELVHPRRAGYPFFGVVEAFPDGETLEERVRREPLSLHGALALALDVAVVARRAHEAGHPLGGIRPELICVRERDGEVSLVGIAHRGPAVLSTTYSGEQIRWPPIFAADFSSSDDARGLAQLVWFTLTGTHPFLAPDDCRWDPSWNEFRHQRRRRQPWTGPPTIGRVLEHALFDSSPVGFDVLVDELSRLRA